MEAGLRWVSLQAKLFSGAVVRLDRHALRIRFPVYVVVAPRVRVDHDFPVPGVQCPIYLTVEACVADGEVQTVSESESVRLREVELLLRGQDANFFFADEGVDFLHGVDEDDDDPDQGAAGAHFSFDLADPSVHLEAEAPSELVLALDPLVRRVEGARQLVISWPARLCVTTLAHV